MRGLIKPRDSKLIFRVKILPEKSTDHQIWYLILMPGQFSTCKRPPIKKGYSLQLLVSISDPVNGFIKISAILRDVILFAALQNFLHYHKHHTWNTAETCEMCESWNQKMNWKLQGKSFVAALQNFLYYHKQHTWSTETCEMCESWNQKMNWKLQGKSVLFFFDLFSSLTTPTCLIFYQQWRIAALFSFVFFCGFYPGKKALTHACDVQFNHN